MLKKLLPVMLALALSAPGLAAPATRKAPTPKVEDKSASVKEAMEAKLGTKISSVTKSPYLGLYEVYADGQILYTDENLTAIIAGTLITLLFVPALYCAVFGVDPPADDGAN